MVDHVTVSYAAAGAGNRWVRMDGYLMPGGWVARWDDPTHAYLAEITVVITDGNAPAHPTITAVTVIQRPGGPGIDAERFRLPLAEILTATAATVALRATDETDDGGWLPVQPDDLKRFQRIFRSAAGISPGRHATDETRLREVARLYNAEAAGKSGVANVADGLNVSYAHAGRLVGVARHTNDPVTGRPYLWEES